MLDHGDDSDDHIRSVDLHGAKLDTTRTRGLWLWIISLFRSMTIATSLSLFIGQLYIRGSEARVDFQLSNFSGHFRASQALTFDSIRHLVALSSKTIQTYIALLNCRCLLGYIYFVIFLCASHILFCLSFVPPAPNPDDDTGLSLVSLKVWRQ